MNKFEDIRGVAFDLDGTLVDSAPGLAAAVDMALYALELPIAGEELCYTRGRSIYSRKVWLIKISFPMAFQVYQ